MLRKELTVALAVVGAMVPFAVQADQPMAGGHAAPAASTYVAGEEVMAGQLPGGYNQSANYVIADGYDMYLTADYIYWHLNREADGISEDASYSSGFQVGLGIDMKGMDDWNLEGQYTWYQNSGNHDSHKFSYNDAHLGFSRPFYFGKSLTADFSTALRGLWISDEFEGHQKSWAVGPRFGFDSNWLLGSGFRLIGDMSQSVLYTRYTERKGSNDYNTLRAVTETSLGLGWGSYFGDMNDFHFDLTVSYDFNIYWNQFAGAGSNFGNDYLQGLNVGLRFDF